MKRQLDRLKGKRLVTGDPNLMTKDEICINATPNGVEVKEIGTDGSIKDIASGSAEGSSISENKKYFKANLNLMEVDFPDNLGSIFTGYLGTVPVYYKPNPGSNIETPYITNLNLPHLGKFDDPYAIVPYYIIDFNSNEVVVNRSGEICRYNNYPNIVCKNSVIETGIEMSEDIQEIINTIEILFNQIFTEITKEEYLEIHNQCIAGTWVPEWE